MAQIDSIRNLTDEEFKSFVQKGMTKTGILKHFGFGCQDARALALMRQQSLRLGLEDNIKDNVRIARQEKRIWNIEQLTEVLPSCNTWSSIALSLGLSTHGTNIIALRDTCIKHNLNFKHVTSEKRTTTSKYDLIDIDYVLSVNLISRSVIKAFVLRNKLIDYECQGCDNKGTWKRSKLILQLDHKNGINNDHRLENLRFLCPNCHSQTETYAAGNKKGKKHYGTQEKPTKRLYLDVLVENRSNKVVVILAKLEQLADSDFVGKGSKEKISKLLEMKPGYLMKYIRKFAPQYVNKFDSYKDRRK
jgi:5-methylcytosine-specific restriction endonuclease McrA